MGGALWGAYRYGCRMGERKALEKLGVPQGAAKAIAEATRQASPDAIQAVGQ
jgi:hypothetical protein